MVRGHTGPPKPRSADLPVRWHTGPPAYRSADVVGHRPDGSVGTGLEA